MTAQDRNTKKTTTVSVNSPEGAARFVANLATLAKRKGLKIADIVRTAIESVYGNELREIDAQWDSSTMPPKEVIHREHR